MIQCVNVTGSGNSVVVSDGGDLHVEVNGHGLSLSALCERESFRTFRVALIEDEHERWIGNIIERYNADPHKRWAVHDLSTGPEMDEFATQNEALRWLLARS